MEPGSCRTPRFPLSSHSLGRCHFWCHFLGADSGPAPLLGAARPRGGRTAASSGGRHGRAALESLAGRRGPSQAVAQAIRQRQHPLAHLARSGLRRGGVCRNHAARWNAKRMSPRALGSTEHRTPVGWIVRMSSRAWANQGGRRAPDRFGFRAGRRSLPQSRSRTGAQAARPNLTSRRVWTMQRPSGPVGDSNPCRPRSRARRPPATSDPSHSQPARTSAWPSSCLPRRGKRVTKMVTKERDSSLSRGITKSHRVTGNPSILLTRPHGTARHSQLPKLDVAGSIPVARSNDDAGLQGTCSPAFALMLPLCARSHRVSPALPMRSHADTFVLGSFIDLATSRLPAGRQRQGLRVGSVRAGAGSSRAWKPPKSVRLSRAMAPFGAHHSVV